MKLFKREIQYLVLLLYVLESVGGQTVPSLFLDSRSTILQYFRQDFFFPVTKNFVHTCKYKLLVFLSVIIVSTKKNMPR